VEWHSANPKPEKHPQYHKDKTSLEAAVVIDEVDKSTINEESINAEEEISNELEIDEQLLAGETVQASLLTQPIRISQAGSEEHKGQQNENSTPTIEPKVKNEAKNLAIWGFTLGMTSSLMIAVMVYFAVVIYALGPVLIFGLSAIVFGIISINRCSKAIKKMRKGTEEFDSKGFYKALAISGMIISILVILFSSAFLISIPFYLG
jgi:uncharacterized membrane protein